MKTLHRALLTVCLVLTLFVPTQAAFLRADITELTIVRDGGANVIGVHFTMSIKDDATSETKEFGYLIQGSELAALPASGLPRRAAIIVIMKRETKVVFQLWVAERLARVIVPDQRSPTTDLGTTQLTNTDVTNPTP